MYDNSPGPSGGTGVRRGCRHANEPPGALQAREQDPV